MTKPLQALAIPTFMYVKGRYGDMVYESVFSLAPNTLFSLLFATALGLLIGVEREWSDKPAGIRTFALVALLGGIFAVIESELLLFSGSLFITVLTGLLGLRVYTKEGIEGLSLTTSVSLLVSYGIGILSANQLYVEALSVAVFSSLLLVLKRELHSFAGTLSKNELKSAVEFAIIAGVVYPILPEGQFGPWNAIDLQLIWLLVISISGIGFVNYLLIQKYKRAGFAFTGFIGGLVNSTAVVASILDRNEEIGDGSLALGGIMLANGAMALRNQILVLVFLPTLGLKIGLPLLGITISAVLISYYLSDWKSDLDATDLKTPFSLKRVLYFGIFFLVIVVMSAGAKETFGDTGFLLTTFLSGLVSSGTVTTTAVALASSGNITPLLAAQGILLGTISSILVKVGLAYSVSRQFGKRIFLWSILLTLVGSALLGVTGVFLGEIMLHL